MRAVVIIALLAGCGRIDIAPTTRPFSGDSATSTLDDGTTPLRDAGGDALDALIVDDGGNTSLPGCHDETCPTNEAPCCKGASTTCVATGTCTGTVPNCDSMHMCAAGEKCCSNQCTTGTFCPL